MVKRNIFITVIVTGVPGVGKTTVLSYAKDIAEKQGYRVRVVNFGDYMFKVARREGWVEHRDQIRHLQLRKQLELQEYAARAIIEDTMSILNEGDVLFVDTHAVVKTSTGFWPGLPKSVVEALKPDSIVVVESSPEIIIKRQQKDRGRMRSDIGVNVDALRELMLLARVAAMASAVLVSASVFIVENVEGNPSIAARKIVELIKSLR